MKKILVLFLVAWVLTGCQSARMLEADINESMALKLGYCPTMRDAAEDFAQNREGVLLASFDSAAEVLQELSTGRIDLALVGRKAEAGEAGGFAERRLGAEAYTLVGPEKGFIQEAELNGLEARTCLAEVVARNEFPELEKLVYAGAEDCRYDDGNVWLISWNDYTDDMRLLIPVNEHGAKVSKYRTPFLYGEKSIISAFCTNCA